MGAKVHIIIYTTKYTFTFYQKIPSLCYCVRDCMHAACGGEQGSAWRKTRRRIAKSKAAVHVDGGHVAARLRENNEGLAVLRSPQGLSKR